MLALLIILATLVLLLIGIVTYRHTRTTVVHRHHMCCEECTVREKCGKFQNQ